LAVGSHKELILLIALQLLIPTTEGAHLIRPGDKEGSHQVTPTIPVAWGARAEGQRKLIASELHQAVPRLGAATHKKPHLPLASDEVACGNIQLVISNQSDQPFEGSLARYFTAII
jgi:hypothetical protein